MIIHKPEIVKDKKWVTVTTRFEMEKNIEDMPESVWYRFPIELAPHLNPDRNDGGLVALFLLAMKYRENISVEGVVSPKLAYQIKEAQKIYSYRTPNNEISPVQITYARLAAEKPYKSDVVGMTFSGGIDSMYTLWSHVIKQQSTPAIKISQAIYVRGYDSFNEDVAYFQSSFDKFEPGLEKVGVKLLPVSTNVVSLYRYRMNWLFAHIPPLLAIPLYLQTYYTKFLIASDGKFLSGRDMSHHLFSTENVEIIESGKTIDKVQKLDKIIDWSFASDGLKVCKVHIKRRDGKACYQCSKCLSTAIMLHILGDRGQSKQFQRPYSLSILFKWWLLANDTYSASKSIGALAKRKKKFLIMWIFRILLIPAKIKDSLFLLIKAMLPLKKLYEIKGKFFPAN